MEEKWKLILEFDGNYSVSSFGNIRRETRGRKTFPGLILKPQNHHGYLKVGINYENKKYCRLIHVLVAYYFIGQRKAGYEVNHKDCDKRNNNFKNLEYVTKSQNSIHALKNGLLNKTACAVSSEKRWNAILNADSVRVIRDTYSKGGITQENLAKKFKISRSGLSHVLNNKTWKNVK